MLIDGTINHFVSQITMLPIVLSCGYMGPIEFFMTKLGGTSPAVLGFNWLQSLNPRIDWKQKTVTISNQDYALEPPNHLPLAPTPRLPEEPADQDLPKSRQQLQNDGPPISLINAIAFHCACRAQGAIAYQLTLLSPTGPKG